MIPEIEASQFNSEVATCDRAVLIEFFTPTCYPCREMLPILDELAKERAAKLKVVKLDTSKNPEFASTFRITSVPNFILFQSGSPIGQRAGRIPKRDLLAWIDSSVS